ncbi:MAG TPA: M14 family zinc carboxypeptidase [Saprospiraceae bacterium]|nr:M14 family zinc carboxypeptidase [Saprospiraceae bacterium]
MRFWLLIPIFILNFIVHPVFAQTVWHSAHILMEGKSIHELNALGIAFDHGHYHPGVSFHGDFTTQELDIIRKAGFKVSLEAEREIENRSSPANCNPDQETAPEFPLPSNYQYGSMNGFLTLAEIYESLQMMRDLYPNLITIKRSLGTYQTVNGNPIYYVKISDNPDQDEAEPEVLYTALHHAREPVSMSQMMFFMWHLLENYNRNPEIAKLVNNRELFFIPCLNPDGYEYNRQTDPNGGGYWRKNRNPNAEGIGTDLNRNYGEGWAFDNSGSSPFGTSDVFRGDGAFSEIETKAIRDFCENRQFSVVMNYHAFGNLLIIPWGYLDRPTADSTHYLAMAEAMTRYNKFKIGTSTQTLDYSVNGTSDDWMYGEQIFKNKIFAFTPEVGYAFWPERKDILRLNQSAQHMNFMAAWYAGECAHFSEGSAAAISLDTNYLNYQVTRTGIQTGPIQISITADKGYIRFLENDLTLNLKAGESIQVSIPYVIDGSPQRGDSVLFSARLTTGHYLEQTTSKKTFLGRTSWDENFADVQKWFSPNSSGWDLTPNTFVSPPNALTDSKDGPMDANVSKIFQNSHQIDLKTARYAYLRFKAKWDMDPDLDFAQVRVSRNGFDFEPLCGKYTKEGSEFQDLHEPVYCGQQPEWVSEWIDLKDYLGSELFFQVYLAAGFNSEKKDGFYIDDIEVFTDITTTTLDAESFFAGTVFPQPAHDKFYLKAVGKTAPDHISVRMIAASGKAEAAPFKWNNGLLEVETANCVPGLYFLSVQTNHQRPNLFKVIIH